MSEPMSYSPSRDVLRNNNGASGDAPIPYRAAADLHAWREAGGMHVVKLTARERALCAEALEQGVLARALASDVLSDTAEFFDAAEAAEGILPESARRVLAALRRGSTDAVLLRGLPTDTAPGPTPRNDDRPPPPRLGHASVAVTVRRLGHELAYAMEKNGSVVHDIFPTADAAASQSNASWQVDLALHTENAFHPLRPDFVVLYCVRAPRDGPATRLVVLEDILAQLADSEISMLKELRFTVQVVDSFRSGGAPDVGVPVSVLGGSPRWPTVRWHETLRGTDAGAIAASQSFADAARRVTREIRLKPGDLLAFANDRCLHGRDRFAATLDGGDRWLLRAYVLRDLTRALPFVAPAHPRTVRLEISSYAQAPL